MDNGRDKSELLYLDGLKGMACIGIFLGHYFGIYKYATEIDALPKIIDNLFVRGELRFVVDEELWLCVFCLISGFLGAYQKINNVRELFKKVVKRFLRFYILILGADIYIYIYNLSCNRIS